MSFSNLPRSRKDSARKKRPRHQSSHRYFGTQNSLGQQQLVQSRFLIIWAFALLALLGLAGRLYVLQVLTADRYVEKATLQHQKLVNPVMPRRPIVDRNGSIIAVDQMVYDIYAHPIYFGASREAVATHLSGVFQQPQPTILAQLQQHDSGIRLKEGLSRGLAEQIRELGISGLDLEAKQQRFYPQGDLFAQITGFVFFDEQRNGQGGIEQMYQERLRRSPGQFTLHRMQDGTLMPDIHSKGFQPQDNLRLQLTLDSRLQQAAQSALKQQLETFAAKQGTVIVMDVWTGALLTLVTEPSYDPNHYYKANVESFRNWAVMDLYEPGSTFKPINVAIALDAGVIEPTAEVYDEGQIQIDTWPISNHDFTAVGGRGPLTISEVLQYSSNVGMVHIMEKMPPGEYHQALTQFGLGEAVSTDLPLAGVSHLKDRSIFEASRVDVATTAFGQGITITPLQMAQLLASIGNGGALVPPHTVAGLVDSQNTLHWQPERPTTQSVVSEAAANTVLTFMEHVVTQGTGDKAAIPNYRIAGKTGTAQKAKDGSYLENARITSFAGILPADSPRYVVLVVIDEPQGDDAYGSTVAAPLAKQVMETLIGLYGLPPSQPATLSQSDHHSSAIEPPPSLPNP